MKSMKEITNMSDAELTAFVQSERAELQKQRFAMSAPDVKTMRAAKKHIARALTELAKRTTATTK